MLFDYILAIKEWFWDFSWVDWISNASWIEIAIKLIILYFALFWFALVIWVARDAINRSNSIIFHVFSILLNIFLPVFGLMIYLLIRSPRTLLDKYYEDLEFQSLSNETKDFCHKCNSIIGQDYKYCWECWEELMCECLKCEKDFFKRYRTCPYCWHKKWKKVDKKVDDKTDEHKEKSKKSKK